MSSELHHQHQKRLPFFANAASLRRLSILLPTSYNLPPTIEVSANTEDKTPQQRVARVIADEMFAMLQKAIPEIQNPYQYTQLEGRTIYEMYQFFLAHDNNDLGTGFQSPFDSLVSLSRLSSETGLHENKIVQLAPQMRISLGGINIDYYINNGHARKSGSNIKLELGKRIPAMVGITPSIK